MEDRVVVALVVPTFQIFLKIFLEILEVEEGPEVEEVLIRHPDVSEVAVIGRPDREWGEAVVAYVVATAAQKIDVDSINNFCTENMARFKRPKIYREINNLPKNNYGKVLKTKLREMEQNKY